MSRQPHGLDGESDDKPTVKVTILDGIVSVNSLFTIAVFLCLTFSPAQQSIETNTLCEADIHITKQLVLFEVISFIFFLFSSIVAQGLKMAIVVLNGKDKDQSSHAVIHLHLLYFGMCSSGFGSVSGSVFLMASIVHVIQIRFGVLRCHDVYTIVAVVSLLVMVPLGLLVYINTVMYAIWKKVKGTANMVGAPWSSVVLNPDYLLPSLRFRHTCTYMATT